MGPQGREILLFEVDGRRFGFLAAEVREIVRVVTITRLPQAPDLVEGVVNLRGQIVPVIDLRRKLGLAAKLIALSDHLVVANHEKFPLAVRVDRALGLWADGAGSPQIGPERVARLADGLAPILDLGALVTSDERRTLAALISQTAPLAAQPEARR